MLDSDILGPRLVHLNSCVALLDGLVDPVGVSLLASQWSTLLHRTRSALDQLEPPYRF